MKDEQSRSAEHTDAVPPLGREWGPTCVVACRCDPRFSYCMYVPERVARGSTDPRLVVAIHGSARYFTAYRDAFASFCRWNDCIVMAPLFPASVRGDGNRDGYKYIVEADIRYDRILLAMIDDVAHAYGWRFDRFALFGYSGGAHFVHRFFMLHPARLWAVSIGAPGNVTLLDPSRDWWIGTRNVRAVFGTDVDVEAMRRVPVQMLVGAADVETWEITRKPGERYWMPGANDSGRTRPERLAALRDSYVQHGIDVRFEVLPNVAHVPVLGLGPVEDFLADVLDSLRAPRQRRP